MEQWLAALAAGLGRVNGCVWPLSAGIFAPPKGWCGAPVRVVGEGKDARRMPYCEEHYGLAYR